ncbi:PRC-barrel domain-containing protein [Methanobrevibacter sp. DSM 116169]|uniref:PRC-barrel domain-containing protein n=1 Tax=Methanobrevibacter sp. DSM 116169 TaxID=3242727 RepID=UPI0038FBE8A2
MRIKSLLGILVLDNQAKEVGKVVDFEFDEKTGKLTKLILSLKKNFISNDEIEIDFEDINTIGDYILLNILIPEKVESIQIEEQEYQ